MKTNATFLLLFSFLYLYFSASFSFSRFFPFSLFPFSFLFHWRLPSFLNFPLSFRNPMINLAFPFPFFYFLFTFPFPPLGNSSFPPLFTSFSIYLLTFPVIHFLFSFSSSSACFLLLSIWAFYLLSRFFITQSYCSVSLLFCFLSNYYPVKITNDKVHFGR